MTELLVLGGLALIALVIIVWKKRLIGKPVPKGLHLGPRTHNGWKNKTVGTKLVGKSFAFPYPNREAGHVHALVQPVSKVGSEIRMRYRVEGEPGLTLHPQEEPQSPAIISLMVQRKGDDYDGKGDDAYARMYSPDYQMLVPGEHEMVVKLDGVGWGGVNAGDAENMALWNALIANVGAVHICFGGGPSRAHGVFASGPSKFTLLSLEY